MKKIIVIMIIVVFAMAPFASADNKKINWLSYKEGIALSKKTNKNVFIFFHTTWCKYCEQMKKTTFKNKKVIGYLNTNFIPITVDGDKEKDIVKKYKIRGYPDSVFVVDGKKFHRPGYVPEETFYVILSYVHTKSYQKMSFSKFLKLNG
ncbi:MAG: thioredoxin fold domain-containing protein [Desulfobacterales bacterium]|nr:thioredoxin fold domain-containing protein [Desulfobacterales bacterium]MCP4159539.1 thioredoxin fold domain-containing protein [Deltaproteobacteria bacterium]